MDRVCPRDFTLLTAREWGAATYQYCATCHGVLLERSEVEKIVRSGTNPPVLQPRERRTFEEGTALCSCSEATMMTVTRQGVSVDVCPACEAVWFDAGELARVVAENRKDLLSIASPETWPAAAKAVAGTDVVKGILKFVVEVVLSVA